MRIERDIDKTPIKYLIYSDANNVVDLSDPEQFYQLLYTQLKTGLLKEDKTDLEFNIGESTKYSNVIYKGSTRKKDLEVLEKEGYLESVNKTRYRLI